MFQDQLTRWEKYRHYERNDQEVTMMSHAAAAPSCGAEILSRNYRPP